ncbi:hypothetical protein ACFXHA_05295 [Nocardia sp. NPDC059240]|uniref:hypothetical protein n=1 Tax=Nocardia sp. NPDC059240 TaxID=3346786 RepID=UPI0036B12CA9
MMVQRRSEFELFYDSSYFTTRQLHPVAAVRLSFLGYARWAAEHAAPFPTMIAEHHAGFAVVGIRLDYGRPFTFLDGTRLQMSSTSRLLSQLTLMETVTTIVSDTTHLATVSLLCRALDVAPGDGMLAAPSRLASSVVGSYRPEEIDQDDKPVDHVEAILSRLDATVPQLVEGTSQRLIDRQLCEAADQWCFTEVIGLVASARETLIDDRADEFPVLRTGLSQRLCQVVVKLRRPLFLHDRAAIRTRMYTDHERRLFVHHISGASGAVHAIAIETLEPPQ